MDEKIPSLEALQLLRELGSSNPPNTENLNAGELFELVRSSNAAVSIDWRASIEEVIEAVNSACPALPDGWALGCSSPQRAVDAARRHGVYHWEQLGPGGTDTAEYLIVLATLWRRIKSPWVTRLLRGVELRPAERPSRRSQLAELANTLLADLVETGDLQLSSGHQANTDLRDALLTTLRRLPLDHPNMGDALARTLLRGKQVEELFADDTTIVRRLERAWKRILDASTEVPESASAGDVVPIRGSRFASAKRFVLGSYLCDVVKKENQLLLKIPDDVPPGHYTLEIVWGGGRVITKQIQVRKKRPSS